ncbi:murein transglycosylase domain-containing protein [Vibrio breoganii]
MKLLLFILTTLTALIGCSRAQIENSIGVSYSVTNRFSATGLAPLPGQFVVDKDERNKIIVRFNREVKNKWGDNASQSSKTRYVKYLNQYNDRIEVDFERETIKVSTVAKRGKEQRLQSLLVTTFLTPDKPDQVDLYSDKAITLNAPPFLLGRIHDTDNLPIRYEWRAKRHAMHLVSSQMKSEHINGKPTSYVQIKMTPVRSTNNPHYEKYGRLVQKAANDYNIPEYLIWTIMKIESSFNPFAVSWAGAYGLMQVVPSTAGVDVFKLVKKKSGKPTPKYLYNPANNIDTGSAYFHILQTRYLKDIKNPQSKMYAMVSAYNGGAGGVFRTFSKSNKEAIRIINSMTSDQVYSRLANNHPNSEARGYVRKFRQYRGDFM